MRKFKDGIKVFKVIGPKGMLVSGEAHANAAEHVKDMTIIMQGGAPWIYVESAYRDRSNMYINLGMMETVILEEDGENQ